MPTEPTQEDIDNFRKYASSHFFRTTQDAIEKLNQGFKRARGRKGWIWYKPTAEEN
jgi:hypothetical protein